MTAGYWDGGYATWPEPVPYGSTETYEDAVGWLAETCTMVEDWGCGTRWAERFIPPGVTYRGIDFSAQARDRGWADVHADLRTWRSRPEGLLMRHVLEHNEDWPVILRNALASFTKRMVLITFTPFSDHTHPLDASPRLDISFAWEDLTAPMTGLLADHYEVASRTHFGREHVFKLTR